jgi:hypothetical protein
MRRRASVIAFVLLLGLLWQTIYYVSESEVRNGLQFQLTEEVQYIGSKRVDGLGIAQFIVPSEGVASLTEVMDVTWIYSAVVSKEQGIERKSLGDLEYAFDGEIIWWYSCGKLHNRPEHMCLLTQKDDVFYFWYIDDDILT